MQSFLSDCEVLCGFSQYPHLVLSKHQTDQIQPKLLSKHVFRLMEKFCIDPGVWAYLTLSSSLWMRVYLMFTLVLLGLVLQVCALILSTRGSWTHWGFSCTKPLARWESSPFSQPFFASHWSKTYKVVKCQVPRNLFFVFTVVSYGFEKPFPRKVSVHWL